MICNLIQLLNSGITKIIYKMLGTSYEQIRQNLSEIIAQLEQDYPNQRKGIFVSNDTDANVLINLLLQKYGKLPEDYYIVGFDDSPISSQAAVPISTVGQHIDQIAHEAMKLLVEQMNERKKRRPMPQEQPIHKVITPYLIRRATTEKD